MAEKEKREKLLVCELSASEGKTSVVNLALVLVVFLAGNKPAKIPVSDRQWSLVGLVSLRFVCPLFFVTSNRDGVGALPDEIRLIDTKD